MLLISGFQKNTSYKHWMKSGNLFFLLESIRPRPLTYYDYFTKGGPGFPVPSIILLSIFYHISYNLHLSPFCMIDVFYLHRDIQFYYGLWEDRRCVTIIFYCNSNIISKSYQQPLICTFLRPELLLFRIVTIPFWAYRIFSAG